MRSPAQLRVQPSSWTSARKRSRFLTGEFSPWFHRAVAVGFVVFNSAAHGDIPWPEVVQRLAYEKQKLARRAGGHRGEYFVVCTLYYTPKESGFTAERGFDNTFVTRPGLHGHRYPRDFLTSVRKEGFGRLRQPVAGCDYIRFNGGNSYAFVRGVVGRGTEQLRPRFSAAMRRGQAELKYGVVVETTAPLVQEIFGSSRWRIVDTGGGLRRWQIDLYWGEDEPLGPGRLMARPRGTEFEYAYSEAKIK